MKSPTLNIIVFSCDRAIQLRETILSIDKHLLGISYEIQVIYKTSSFLHQQGYDLLRSTLDVRASVYWHLDAVDLSFWKVVFPSFFTYTRNLYWYLKYPILRNRAKDFKHQLETLIQTSSTELTMFMVDDAVFYTDSIIPNNVLDLFMSEPEATSYKFHLGANHEGIPEVIEKKSAIVKWNYYDNNMTSYWAYPFALCSSVYNTKTLIGILHPVLYNSPNTLEGNCCFYCKQKKLLRRGYSPFKNSVYGFALNQVQNDFRNVNGKFDIDLLCEYYLAGYNIVYELPNTIIDLNVIPRYVILVKDASIIRIDST